MDVSSLVGKPIELEVQLNDNNGTIGDSWARIDNVVLGATREDFEAGTVGGFNVSLNPTAVSVIPGALNGTGDYVLQMNEDPAVTPTILFRDFSGSSATILTFDMSFTGSSTSGFLGLDNVIVRLLDPLSLSPLLSGVTPGFGDLLAVDSSGVRSAGGVSIGPVQPVPAPGAVILGIIGSGSIGLIRRHVKGGGTGA